MSSIASLAKSDLIKMFQVSATDTGSPQVQAALLSKRITELSEHLKLHKQDKHSRRGLLGMVGQRRRLFQYIEKKEGAAALLDLKRKLELK
jgi:small subunit ribosomal protein S15